MWATPEDIKSRWISNKPFPADAKLSIFIEDVEAQILQRYPLIQTRINDLSLPSQIVRSTIARIITEFLLTDGTPFSEETQAYSGIGSRTIKVASTARKSLLLTEADYAIFAPASADASVVSITMNAAYSNESLLFKGLIAGAP